MSLCLGVESGSFRIFTVHNSWYHPALHCALFDRMLFLPGELGNIFGYIAIDLIYRYDAVLIHVTFSHKSIQKEVGENAVLEFIFSTLTSFAALALKMILPRPLVILSRKASEIFVRNVSAGIVRPPLAPL